METLETRRMMIAEGSLHSITLDADPSGLVGEISGTWDWGDGRTTAASINADIPEGNVQIRFDYSLDTRGFFADNQRRQVLQAAADSLVDRLADDLSAISVQSPYVTWTPRISHPSREGLFSLPSNPTVRAGEIVIYAGSQPLAGDQVGEGGPGSIAFQTSGFTFSTQAERQQIEALIESDRQQIFGRGQAGALASPQTDVSVSHGSISFDSTESNFHFGAPDEIEPGQIDFFSVATHELAHVLGFGIEFTGATSSWDRLVTNNEFTGAAARAVYQGSGNVPVVPGHWAASVRDDVGQETLMAAALFLGRPQPFSQLDYAGLDDLGWEVLPVEVTATGSHRYADNATYAPTLVLEGSRGGRRVIEAASVDVTNVAPTLELVDDMSVIAGTPLRITDLGTISDMGFRNGAATPPTDETFTASIDWGDGSDIETVVATIDRIGNSDGQTTAASFDGQHTFDTPGVRTVRVTVDDDDGGSVTRSFTVTVFETPSLTVTVSQQSIDENAGDDAAILTVRRTGPIDQPLVVNVQSSDESEATATSVTIGVNERQAQSIVSAVDDAVLDGTQTVTFTVSAAGVVSQSVAIEVDDYETIIASPGAGIVREGDPAGIAIPIRRSNFDIDEAIAYEITGGDSSELALTAPGEILVGRRNSAIRAIAVDDGSAEPIQALTYTITAAGYRPSTFTVNVLDDERPSFQNPQDRYDTDGSGDATPVDALAVINFIRRIGGSADLDPIATPPQPQSLVDVNGDYRVTPLDALEIINTLRRRRNSASGEPTADGLAAEATSASPISPGWVDRVIDQVESERRDRSHWEWADSWWLVPSPPSPESAG